MSYGFKKGTKQSTTARRYVFKFHNANEIERFILLYSDLFVPYADCTAHAENRYYEKHENNDLVRHYEEGYIIRINEKKVEAKMEGEQLKSILATNMFRKEKIQRSRFMYVYEG